MSKTKKILYWVFTIWLALGLTSTGLVQLLKVDDEVRNFEHLGYPQSLMTILGIWKLLAAVAILVPKFPLVKEWAYAGCFFLTSGAIFSYISSEDGIVKMLPAVLLLALTVVSWYLRPESRRISTKEIVVS